MTSDQLFTKARDLETLANDVETALDGAKACAASPLWECQNATDVRGAIDTYVRACQTAAANLRTTASQTRSEAWRVKAQEDAAARAKADGAQVPV